MIHKENYMLFYSVEGGPNANIQCLPECFFGDFKSQDPTLNTSSPQIWFISSSSSITKPWFFTSSLYSSEWPYPPSFLSSKK